MQVAVKPYRVERGIAHFDVSKCEFDNLNGQVDDAAAFLRNNCSDINRLMSDTQASGVLDFAVEFRSEGFQFCSIPAPFVREAARFGLSLMISLYPHAASRDATPPAR
jgi:hypothetical protein